MILGKLENMKSQNPLEMYFRIKGAIYTHYTSKKLKSKTRYLYKRKKWKGVNSKV